MENRASWYNEIKVLSMFSTNQRSFNRLMARFLATVYTRAGKVYYLTEDQNMQVVNLYGNGIDKDLDETGAYDIWFVFPPNFFKSGYMT